jgi:hypothetical protein
MEKRHRKGYQGTNTILKQCYRAAYPNKLCPQHAEAAAIETANRMRGLEIPEEDTVRVR